MSSLWKVRYPFRLQPRVKSADRHCSIMCVCVRARTSVCVCMCLKVLGCYEATWLPYMSQLRSDTLFTHMTINQTVKWILPFIRLFLHVCFQGFLYLPFAASFISAELAFPVNGIKQCGPSIWLVVCHVMFSRLICVGVVEFVHSLKMFSHLIDPLNGHTTVFTTFPMHIWVHPCLGLLSLHRCFCRQWVH